MMDMRTCGSVAVSRATAARHIVGKQLLFIIYYRAVYMIYMIYMEAASALASVRLPTSSVCLKESKSACEHDTPERTDAMICGHTHTYKHIPQPLHALNYTCSQQHNTIKGKPDDHACPSFCSCVCVWHILLYLSPVWAAPPPQSESTPRRRAHPARPARSTRGRC